MKHPKIKQLSVDSQVVFSNSYPSTIPPTYEEIQEWERNELVAFVAKLSQLAVATYGSNKTCTAKSMQGREKAMDAYKNADVGVHVYFSFHPLTKNLCFAGIYNILASDSKKPMMLSILLRETSILEEVTWENFLKLDKAAPKVSAYHSLLEKNDHGSLEHSIGVISAAFAGFDGILTPKSDLILDKHTAVLIQAIHIANGYYEGTQNAMMVTAALQAGIPKELPKIDHVCKQVQNIITSLIAKKDTGKVFLPSKDKDLNMVNWNTQTTTINLHSIISAFFIEERGIETPRAVLFGDNPDDYLVEIESWVMGLEPLTQEMKVRKEKKALASRIKADQERLAELA